MLISAVIILVFIQVSAASRQSYGGNDPTSSVFQDENSNVLRSPSATSKYNGRYSDDSSYSLPASLLSGRYSGDSAASLAVPAVDERLRDGSVVSSSLSTFNGRYSDDSSYSLPVSLLNSRSAVSSAASALNGRYTGRAAAAAGFSGRFGGGPEASSAASNYESSGKFNGFCIALNVANSKCITHLDLLVC
ncbi:hypothetical protein NPIL_246761 [Nephila pilipes]|uniref:Uncharacterized protein n=1 Tax=Nephila pilipes TaxID=299642 RepID=A0A8X6PEE5_NEPPI|nr:hypothetical protein NPIL_246761 [Nephila pilipes]